MIHAGTIRIGFRVDGPRLRRILNELDQPIAEHYLSGRDGDLLADFESFGTDGTASAEHALEILEPVPETAYEVLTGFSACPFEQIGVGVQKIRRRCSIEYLPAGEPREACVFARTSPILRPAPLATTTPNSRMRVRKR